MTMLYILQKMKTSSLFYATYEAGVLMNDLRYCASYHLFVWEISHQVKSVT